MLFSGMRFFLIFTFSFSVFVANADHQFRPHKPSYESIIESLYQLESSHPLTAQTIIIGQSVAQRPQVVLKLAHKYRSFSAPRPAVFITEAIHGDEFLGVTNQLAQDFLTLPGKFPKLNEFLDRGGVVFLLPIFNPDGYIADTRQNANGADLNRDFDSVIEREYNQTQPEVRNWIGFLEAQIDSRQIELRLMLDYHCCAEALIYPLARSLDPLPAKDQNLYRQIGRDVQSIFGYNFRHGQTIEVLRDVFAFTSMDFFYQKHRALSFGFEGYDQEQPQKIEKHRLMWEYFFGLMSVR